MMRRYQISVGFALIGLALAAPASWGRAQSATSLSGPVLGYVFNGSDGSLRPLRGTVGNATVGPAVDLGFTIARALELDGRHFIASTESNPNLVSIDLGTDSAKVSAISVPRERYLLGAAGSGGSAAAFYGPGGAASIVTGPLLGAPLVQTVGLDVPGDGVVTRIAVSADGKLLVYAVRFENRESLYAWTGADSPARPIGEATSVGDFVITAGGAVIVADRGANEVFAIADVRNSPARQFWADSRTGVSDPSGIAVSSRNQVYVANASSVMTLDSSGRLLRSAACNCVLSGLHAMQAALFRLTDGVDQTVFLMDTSSAEERIVFVPPLSPVR